MGRCLQGLCRSFIVSLNAMVLMVSMAICSVAIYVIVQQYNDGLVTGQESWPVFVPLAFGLFLLLASLVGCCVTLEDKHCMIGFFALIQFVFGAIILAGGLVMVLYTEYLIEISVTPVNLLEPGLFSARESLSDFTLGLYGQCCGVSLVPPPGQCQAPSNDLNTYCFFDPEAFQSSSETDPAACQNLVAEFNLCNDASSDGTGLKNFQADVAQISKDYAKPSGYAFVVFGAILLLASFGSCYLSCCASQQNKGKQASGSGGPQYRQQQQQNNNNGQHVNLA